MKKSSIKLTPATIIPVFRTDKPMFLQPSDKEWKGEVKHIEKMGFSGTECICLDYTIACFIFPRLESFRNNLQCVPEDGMTKKQWADILDKMLFSFRHVIEGKLKDHETEAKVQEGLELFGKWFQALWS